MWFLYLIVTKNGYIYTGISTDVDRRFIQHSEGSGAKYLRGKGPLHLAYSYKIGTRSAATKAEIRIKKLSHVEKKKLIEKTRFIEDLLP